MACALRHLDDYAERRDLAAGLFQHWTLAQVSGDASRDYSPEEQERP